MTKGRFGIHGGKYIPETLMNAVLELERAYEYYKNDKAFWDEVIAKAQSDLDALKGEAA